MPDVVERQLLVPQLFDEEFRKAFPNVTRYFMTVVNQPEFKKVMGEVSLAKETAKYTPKAAPKPDEQPKKESKPAPPPQVCACKSCPKCALCSILKISSSYASKMGVHSR